jgi:hypothetical protein
MPDLFVTLVDLAERLKLPRDWLRYEADAGRIPCLRVRGRLRFNPFAVELALAVRATQGREVSRAI